MVGVSSSTSHAAALLHQMAGWCGRICGLHKFLKKLKFLHGKLLIMKFLYKLTTVRDISAGDM